MVSLLASCSYESKIERVREVPLKSTQVPAIQTGLHRAQVTYLMRGALTQSEMYDRLGQYYFVTWTDGHPDQPAELIMSYQQASTGSLVLQKKLYFEPRKSSGTHKDVFKFIGEEHRRVGQVLSWRVDLKVGGTIVSTRRSYLWRDDHTTSTRPAELKPEH